MKGRLRPSKPVSWAALVVGILFLLFGIFFVLPIAGFFGIIWFVFAFAFTLFYFVNATSDKGLSLYTFDLDQGGESEEDEPDFETKLRKLESLRKDELISEGEYQEKRVEIMGQKW